METKNIIISPEYLDRIRKYTAICPQEIFMYVPVAYRELPETMRPLFSLRPISGEDALRYADEMRGEVTVADGSSKAQVSVKRGAYTISTVRAGLIGWKNYYTLDGKPVEYIGKMSVEALPVALLEELSDIIVGRAALTEEELLGLK